MKIIDVKKTFIRDADGPAAQAYERELTRCQPLTASQEAELIRRYQEENDLRARDRLAERNQRFILLVARKYAPVGEAGYDLMDLVQWGSEGFLTALDRFEPARGIRLLSYAVEWISKEILIGIGLHQSLIRRPSYHYYALSRAERIQARYEAEHGVAPTEETLRGFLRPLDAKVLEQNQQVAWVGSTLQAGEALAVATASEEEAWTKQETIRYLQNILATLPVDDQRLLAALYGLNGEAACSQSQVAQRLGLRLTDVTRRHQQLLTYLRETAHELVA
jgi:RNA polymerase primary sigma factor